MLARRAALLAIVALLLAPTTLAENPTKESWAPYDAGFKVLALGVSRASNVTAIGVDGCSTPGQGCPTDDLFVLTTDHGFAHSEHGVGAVAQGRVLVAVSDDGSIIASLGNDSVPSTGSGGSIIPTLDPTNPQLPGGSGPSVVRMRLAVARIAPGGNWSSATETNRTVTIPGYPTQLVLAGDGSRIAIATGDGTTSSLLAYDFAQDALSLRFNLSIPGTVLGLAASHDLSQLYVAAKLADPNGTLPKLLQVPYLAGAAQHDYSTGLNGTLINAVATDDSGGIVSAGLADGRVLTFRNGLDQAFLAASTGGQGASRLAMTPDGARALAAQGAQLALLDTLNATPRWTGPAGGDVNDVAINRAGTLAAAATSAGVAAFGEADATPLWTIPGAASHAWLSASGDEVVFTQASTVSAQKLAHGISFEYIDGTKTGLTHAVGLSGNTSFDASVRNTGSAPELVDIIIPADNAFTANATPAQVYVKPGEAKAVRVDVTPASDFHGTRAFSATAKSRTSNATDDLSFSFQLAGTANVRLEVNQTDLVGAQNAPTTFVLGVVNTGDKDTAVGVRATQRVSSGAAWNLTMEPTSFTSFGKSRSTIRVVLTPPPGVENGTSDAITFNLEGADVADQATVTVRINPALGIDVNAAGRVKFIAPGRTAFFNVTVTNTGSLERQFEAFPELTPTGKTTWAVDMPSEPFTLAPLAVKTLTVRVVAPFDVTPADHLTILVTARSIPGAPNETRVMGNVTLFANGDVAPTPTPTATAANGIPFVTPAWIAGVALIATALARWRRSS